MTASPALHETHISILFLIGDRAYKLKKPVRFPFIDLSTVELRRRACHREVELNRRLAPDVYLGVADIVDPDGAVCDHLVVMRRMPDDRRLAHLVTAAAVREEDLVALARTIAAFHARADRSPEIAASAGRDALRDRWDAEFRELRPFVGSVLDEATARETEDLVDAYLQGRAPLFERRMGSGCVVDGHGDLLADDVFLLPDGPRILDCLEFDDDLRHGDVVADVAFLAMDLERLGAPQLATRLWTAYHELAGSTAPASLEHHYVALRAHIRAKVACLQENLDQARSLHALARSHLLRGRVTLVLVGGAPGSGKSTLAAGIADRTGWSLLRSDEVRKDLAGIGHTEHRDADFGEGMYSEAATDATYRELLARAETLLGHGESVVLDATWGDPSRRRAAAGAAAATASMLVELCCTAPRELRARRVADRMHAGNDASDATVEVARIAADRWTAWPSAREIDTSGRIESSLELALRVLGVDHDD